MTDVTPSEELTNPLSAAVPVRITDPAEAALSIINRILAAPTVEDIFKQIGTTSADEILNRPFTLVTTEFRKSEFEEGSPVYSFMGLMFEDNDAGTVEAVTCGGQNVNAQILRYVQLVGVEKDGKTLKAPMPHLKLVKTDKPTAAGFYPLWLTLADAA